VADTILAHITPEEVEILKDAGGEEQRILRRDRENFTMVGGYGNYRPISTETAPSYTPTAGDWSGYQPVEIPSAPAMSPVHRLQSNPV